MFCSPMAFDCEVLMGDNSLCMLLLRAIGDWTYKQNPQLPVMEQKVIPFPTITHNTIELGDKLLIMCDGLVEAMENKEVVEQFYALSEDSSNTEADVMSKLLLYSMRKGSNDNHTAMIVSFENGDQSSHSQSPVLRHGPFTAHRTKEDFTKAYFEDAVKFGYSGGFNGTQQQASCVLSTNYVCLTWL